MRRDGALARRVEAEPEGASLAVPADAPPLPRVDDLSAELAHEVKRRFHVRDGEVGEGHPVPRSRAPLVQAKRGTVSASLPAVPLAVSTGVEPHPHELGPKAAGPGRLVGRELHESDGRCHSARIPEVCHSLLPGAASAPGRGRDATRPIQELERAGQQRARVLVSHGPPTPGLSKYPRLGRPSCAPRCTRSTLFRDRDSGRACGRGGPAVCSPGCWAWRCANVERGIDDGLPGAPGPSMDEARCGAKEVDAASGWLQRDGTCDPS